MTSTDASTDDRDSVLSQLSVIEAQPLEDRAAAYAQLHDQLQSALEGSDIPRADVPPSDKA